VPRSFLGPLVISLLASPFVAVINVLGLSKFYAQFVGKQCAMIHYPASNILPWLSRTPTF